MTPTMSFFLSLSITGPEDAVECLPFLGHFTADFDVAVGSSTDSLIQARGYGLGRVAAPRSWANKRVSLV
jgi:hypothetical protein